MKKFWKAVAAILACVSVVSVCLVAACQGMEDIAPETYGEWDGNYIYRANGKIKTTGEDYEKLVSSFTVDEKEYTVTDCLDYGFMDDDIYMILVGKYELPEDGEETPETTEEETTQTEEEEAEWRNAVIKYNILGETQTLLFGDGVFENASQQERYYRATSIAKITSEKIYLNGVWKYEEEIGADNVPVRGAAFAVDHNGNFSTDWYEDDENFVEIETPSDIQIFKEWNAERHAYVYYARENEQAELKEILSCTSSYLHDVYYLEQNGVRGLVLEKYYRSTDQKGYRLSSLEFYSLDTFKKYGETLSVGDRFQKLYDRYYYLYDYKTIEYSETFFERKTADVHTNGRFCELVLEEDGLKFKELHKFADETDIHLYGFHNNELVYRLGWYDSASCGNIFGGHETAYYVENLETSAIRKIEYEEARDLEDQYMGYYEIKSGITVGDHIYFLHTETVGGLMAHSTAYLLKRYNEKEDKFEVMQLWHEDDANLNREPSEFSHFCAEFWGSVTDKLLEFKILDY